MTEETNDKLEFCFENESQMANWSMLKLHHKRDALYIVSQELILENVSQVLAEDQAEQVGQWLAQKLIRKPSSAEIETWQKDEKKEFAKFMIVQPFVLMQIC